MPKKVKTVLILLDILLIFFVSFSTLFYLSKSTSTLRSETKATPALPSKQIREYFVKKNEDATIFLTGDIMLGRSVMKTSLAKNDLNYPFEKVASILKSSNIVFGNLENAIITNCPMSDTGLKFCTDPKMIQGMTDAGINIVNLANNHSGNYGQDGISQTEKYLNDAGINYVGRGNLIIKDIDGNKFGFLGFNFVDNKPDTLDYQLVNNSKKKVDILIVMVHWGTEYTPDPTNTQKQIANDLVGSGADVVVGSHPHVVQSIDSINGKPIFYSLGNFVFDQPWSEETKKGLAIRLTYSGKNLSKIEKLPVYMKNIAQPEWTN